MTLLTQFIKQKSPESSIIFSNNEEAGYTLVEVLVASAVFAIVFTMVVLLFTRTTSEYSGWQTLTATQIAETVIQESLINPEIDSQNWKTQLNGVEWAIRREVEETTPGIVTIRVTVNRQNNGKTYASLWTQVYCPHDLLR